MSIFIFADKFFLEGKVVGPGFLEIKDGKFGIFLENRPEEVEEIIDYAGYWIAPGLVDTHIHGFRNHDVMDNNFEGTKSNIGRTPFLRRYILFTDNFNILNRIVE